MTKKTIGIIGAGFRGLNTLANAIFDTADETLFDIGALADIDQGRLREGEYHVQKMKEEAGRSTPLSLYEDFRQLIEDPRIDIVMVTTPQCAHGESALPALASGKKVYLDKPIAHNVDDARAIVEAERRCENPLLMGFTRRYESSWRQAHALLSQGVIGDLKMMQIRSVIPFDTYFHRWHRKRKWSGGAINDKSSHHMDVFNWFAGSGAKKIVALGGRAVYKEREDAPERCSECDDRECPYRVKPTRMGKRFHQSPEALERGDAWTNAVDQYHRVDTCVHKAGADIYDHASIQVSYGNGVLAHLFLSFFGPKAKDQETFEIVGSKGRIILTRHTGSLDIVSDYGEHQETLDARDGDFGSSHFGADRKLIRELSRFAAGAKPEVSATNGYESVRMITAALRSIDKGGKIIDVETL